MQIRFAELKRESDGYIASFSPIVYTLVEGDAFKTELDLYNFTDTDIKVAIVDPLMKILSQVDKFDINIYCSNEPSPGVYEDIATIHIDDSSMEMSGNSNVNRDVILRLTQLASLLNMFSFELATFYAQCQTSSKPVTQQVAQTLQSNTADNASASTNDIDNLIAEIQQRTKADVVKPKETLKDYVCDSTLKEELLEIKDFFEKENEYKSRNIEIPKGILFKGKPGTGKTYAARCIAGDVDCYFMICTASSLQGQYIGSGAQNIKDLFKAAKLLRENTKKGVIVFIDELDSLGSREHRSGSSSGEEDRTLNQLLAELSGFESSEGIMVMGATNYPDRIDDALMRAGRFSRQITIRPPEAVERQHLVTYYFNKINMKVVGTDYAEISELTKGLTPADIKEIANESAILAVRYSKPDITIDYINEAINKVITKNIRTPDGKLDTHLVAAHEAGHVVAAYIYNNSIAIKVTNYSYGDAGGFTQPADSLEGLVTADRILNEVKELLAGRAAESVICKKVTTGASNDLEKAKRLIKQYYKTYYFEPYTEEKLDQLIQDKIHSLYRMVVADFKQPDTLLKLTKVTDALVNQRVLFTKDLAPILITITGGLL